MNETIRGAALSLREREKELTCLYAIVRELTDPGTSIDGCVRSVHENLPAAFRRPASLDVFVETPFLSLGAETPGESPRLSALSEVKGRGSVRIVVRYPEGFGEAFLDREQDLINTLAFFLANALSLRLAEEESREREAALRERNLELERKNIALREVLSALEVEKRRLRERLRKDIALDVLPRLKRLGLRLGEKGREAGSARREEQVLLARLAQAIRELGRSGERARPDAFDALSPREAEICDLIRGGMSSKEIASGLRISEATVERHRAEIRKKLGLNNRPVNLAAFLRNPRRR